MYAVLYDPPRVGTAFTSVRTYGNIVYKKVFPDGVEMKQHPSAPDQNYSTPHHHRLLSHIYLTSV
jgi:hypothetical protein